jgi:OmpA-OmpF porin, OOP family
MFRLFICSLACCLASANTQAQGLGGKDIFVPGDKTVFEDNFNSGSPADGHLQRWFTWPCEGKFGYLNRKYYEAQEVNHVPEIKIKASAGQVPPISPLIGGVNYLNDVFTIEYYFTLDTPGAATAVCFEFSKKLGNCLMQSFEITNDGDRGLLFKYRQPDSNSTTGEIKQYSTKIPCSSIYRAWRHFGLSYKNHSIKCFVDSVNVLTIADCDFTPLCYYQKFTGPVRMRNVVIAKGEGKTIVFNQLYTEKKFSTHAILFDVNKSTIKEESFSFIIELAEWLKKNPGVNLEIGGHTDSEGDELTNLKLSQGRADEVKKQLIERGVFMKRLTTKGLGATQPLQSNATAEGRANNRRVEFVKM